MAFIEPMKNINIKHVQNNLTDLDLIPMSHFEEPTPRKLMMACFLYHSPVIGVNISPY